VEESLQHLAKFGPFDEVVVGRNWSNSAGVKFMSQEYPGPVATPQVLVIERTVQSPDDAHPLARRAYLSERLLLRKVCVEEIATWANAGSPVDMR
jgi:hypothetical protein